MVKAADVKVKHKNIRGRSEYMDNTIVKEVSYRNKIRGGGWGSLFH
jgi:hypothetical protein